MNQKVIKTGNSLAVTIPAEFARATGTKSGLTVVSNFDIATGVVTLFFPKSSQLSLISK